ncbi:MAG: T9SS type A sorting domain-containing protein, partial [Bacteroidales bacterium]
AGGIAISGQTGNIRVSGTRTYNAGANYIYNGTADQVTGDGLTQNTPADLTIFNTGTTNKTVSLSAATILTGNLLISQGILSSSAGNYNMTVGGNWTNNGTFTANSNTVTFNGTTQTIGGTTPLEKFNSLTISSSTSTTANVNEDLTANLNISSGSLIISAGHYLNVGGSTTLGSAECLILKSDATGTASFIDNGTISGTGTAKVERYLTKYNYAGLPPDYKFHFLSSPVVGQAIMPEFQTMSNTTDDFYMWAEQAPIDQWINTKSGDGITLPFTWNPDFEAANGSSFVSGRGYLVAYPTDVTKYFIGKPYTNAAGLTVTCTHTTAPGTDPIRGWNLIGNPFPSAVDWDYMISHSLLSANVDHALYYYDNSVPRYRYYIPLTGGIGNSLSGADGYIPAMQGVMVHVNLPGTSESVTFRNDARDHRNLTTYYKDAPLTDNVLNITVEGDNSRDDARICFYDLATENFDGSYDAYKLFSYNTTIPELYSVTTDSSQLAINTLPLSQMYVTVPLGFLPGTTGIFTFSAEGVNRFPSTTYIFLEDLKTKTLQKLNDNQAYNFTSTPSDDANRFLLHFQDATSISNPEIGKNITIHAENGVITVLQTGNQNGNIKVTDLAGRTVSTTNLIAGSPAIINMHGNPGVYIVSIITNNGVSNAKIIVK